MPDLLHCNWHPQRPASGVSLDRNGHGVGLCRLCADQLSDLRALEPDAPALNPHSVTRKLAAHIAAWGPGWVERWHRDRRSAGQERRRAREWAWSQSLPGDAPGSKGAA